MSLRSLPSSLTLAPLLIPQWPHSPFGGPIQQSHAPLPSCHPLPPPSAARRGFYDRKKLFWKDIEDTILVAACAPPGGGRQEMTARFVRHFTMLNVPPPSEQVGPREGGEGVERKRNERREGGSYG